MALPTLPIAKLPPVEMTPEKHIVMAPDLQSAVYMDWVTASLREYEEVEIVGIDPGLADTIAVVLQMQNSGIAAKRELHTLTMQTVDKSPKSCIRCVLGRGQTLVRELKTKERLDESRPKSTSAAK